MRRSRTRRPSQLRVSAAARRRAIAGGTALLGCALALAACGEEKRVALKPQAPVKLTIAAPADTATVSEETVEVRGTVSPPTATVRVLGRPAAVHGGGFSVVVPLDPGANVVDVMASASRRASSLTAIRVTREVRVAVPDLVGTLASDLDDTLEPLGLVADVEQGGSIIDSLLPLRRRICEQEPAEGTLVRRGTTVHVVVARNC